MVEPANEWRLPAFAVKNKLTFLRFAPDIRLRDFEFHNTRLLFVRWRGVVE